MAGFMLVRVGLGLRRHMCGEATESDVMSTERSREVRIQRSTTDSRGHWALSEPEVNVFSVWTVDSAQPLMRV
jgi:hypothetical protein